MGCIVFSELFLCLKLNFLSFKISQLNMEIHSQKHYKNKCVYVNINDAFVQQVTRSIEGIISSIQSSSSINVNLKCLQQLNI